MELKSGYKQTEVGVIPEDWGIDVIKNAYEIRNDLRLPLSENVRKKMQGPYPYYGPTKAQDYINEYRVEGEYCLIGEDGDHFLKWKDMPMTLLVRGKFNVNNHAHLVCGIRNETTWFYYYFKNRDITRHLTRQGAGRYKLTKGTLENIPLAIPPTKAEQTAIANALSDADALIQSLTRLIAKKRQIKQAAMQILLNPYENGWLKEGWVVKKIGSFTDATAGGTPSTLVDEYWGGDIKWMSSGELNKKRVYDVLGRITEEGLKNSATKIITTKCVLIGLAGQGKTRGTVAMNFVELCTNQSIAAIFPCTTVSTEFLYFNLDVRYEELRNLSTGDGGRGGLNLRIIKNLDVWMPKKLEEQLRIATVLSDMDTEIAALETKLTKYQHIKQGMMQNLLTGRIRLI